MTRHALPRYPASRLDVTTQLLRGLTQAIESMHLGVTVKGLDGRIVYTNPAEARMHGYAVEDLLGQDANLLAPSEFHRPLGPDDALIGDTWRRESVNIRRDGTRFPVRLVSDVIRERSGEPIGVVTTCEDISERLDSERALRSTEARYRQYVDRAVYGILRCEPSGKIVEFNPALMTMLACDTADEVTSLNLAEDVFTEPGSWALLLAQLGDGTPQHGIDATWRDRRGRVRDVRLSGYAVRDQAGVANHVELLAEDVTEHEVLRAQLQQSQKMELLGRWTGGIAHDFNNILTVILTNAEILGDALESGSSAPGEEFADLLRELRHAARSGTAIVRKLLSFGRRRRVTLDPLDLGVIVEGILPPLRRLLPETIEVRVENAPDLPQVRVDAGVVEQILLNLATNARDAMTEGGTIHITIGTERIEPSHRITHGWGDPGDYVCVAVRDTGQGMDDETLGQIYEPFFTTKPAGAGTGLGMAMVYGLMKQHHGFVDVRSTPGTGTTATVYFPVADRVVSEVIEPEPMPGAHHGSETVLFVEDEETIRRATKRYLEQLGYRVLLASDGAQALRIIQDRSSEIDVVVSDLLMPRMTGSELYRRVRAAGLSTRFVFVSGYTRDSDKAREAVASGAPFLDKPWMPLELAETVRAVLDQQLTGELRGGDGLGGQATPTA